MPPRELCETSRDVSARARRAERDTRCNAGMTAQLLADAQRVLRSCASGSAAQLVQQAAQRSLAQQVAHRLLELRARSRST